MSAPIVCRWDGEAFRPATKVWADRAAKEFVQGEKYVLSERQDRSLSSHRHYFAAINHAWTNLPEKLAERFPSAETLRKWALVKAGFCHQEVLTLSSHEEAMKVGRFARLLDGFAVIDVKGDTVVRYSAKSQSVSAMDKKEFQASKEAVLDIVASLIGTTAKALTDNTGKAA